MNKETIERYQDLESEKAELTVELRRIDGFFNRDSDNKDNERAINAGKVFVKFAGTACRLPMGIFTGALNARKAEINQRLSAIEDELNAL